MTTFCQCPFDTASVANADGVMVCAVCDLPKRRVWPDMAYPLPEAALAMGLPHKTLRGLIASGRVTPTHRDGKRTFLRPAHGLAQLSKGGIK